MGVVFLVAGRASRRRALEHIVPMAFPALHGRVSARELEPGQVVIELRRLPAVSGVAVRTGVAESTGVRIIASMAAGAVPRRGAELQTRVGINMAFGTVDIRVLARQPKSPLVVVEGTAQRLDSVVTACTGGPKCQLVRKDK